MLGRMSHDEFVGEFHGEFRCEPASGSPENAPGGAEGRDRSAIENNGAPGPEI
jgi:hypothetical protein